MIIADFLIKLGVKGADGAAKGVKGIAGQMNSLRSTSLETKAAILGMVYGLQRMMSGGMALGSNIQQFENQTGILGETLQRWQGAGKWVSATNEDIAASFAGVQKVMGAMARNEGAPKYFDMLTSMVDFDLSKIKDTEYVLKKMGEFLRMVPHDIGNEVAASFGVTGSMIQGLRRDGFNDKQLAKSRILSSGEAKNLERLGAQWDDIGDQFTKGFAKIFATGDGNKMVKEIAGASKEILKLITAFTKLSNSAGLFTVLNDIIKGWSMIFKEINDVINKISAPAEKDAKPRTGVTGALLNANDAVVNKALLPIYNFLSDKMAEAAYAQMSPDHGSIVRSVNTGAGITNLITQNLNFTHDGRDAVKLKESAGKGVDTALRKMDNIQRQGM